MSGTGLDGRLTGRAGLVSTSSAWQHPPGVTGGEAAQLSPSGRALVEAAFLGTDALLVIIGEDARALVANPAMTRATGWSQSELTSAPFWDVYVAPEDRAGAREDFARFMPTGLGFAVEGDWLDRFGGRRRISMQINALRDAHGRPFAMVVMGVDVTEQRRQEAVLRQHAVTDALTGLLNRRAVVQALAAELAKGSSGCGVLFCDLDGLKAANDRDGHHAGDLLLQATADRLRAATDVRDVVARFGGDEFVILRPGTDEASLRALAAGVQAALTQPVGTADGPLQVGVSIGTAVGHPGMHPDEVLRAADRDMYRVKTTRRATRRP